MTEMTVGEAIFALHKNGVILSNSIKRQIAALLESQAAEIEKLKSQITELHDDEAMERIYQDGLHNGAIKANNHLEAAEKVCRAAEALSLLYDGELDINSPLLYETWRDVDEALAEWKEAQKNGKS